MDVVSGRVCVDERLIVRMCACVARGWEARQLEQVGPFGPSGNRTD